MNYLEALEVTVSKKEAQREIEKHQLLWDDFIEECGDCEEYKGDTILNWLGY